jgi:hypothetical protein
MSRTNSDAILKSITIENFKAFGAQITFPFKPITMLFGGNSAGKSTVLKALVYLKGVLNQGHHPERVNVSGNLVDFGVFADVVHGHDSTKSIRIAVDFEFPEAEEGMKINNPMARINAMCKRTIRTGRIGITVFSECVYADVWLNGEEVWSCDITRGDIWLKNESELVRDLFLDWQSRGNEDWFSQDALERMELSYRAGQELDFSLMWNDYKFEYGYEGSNLSAHDKELHERFFGYDRLETDPRIYNLGVVPIRLLKRMLSAEVRYIGPLREVPKRNQGIHNVSRNSWHGGLAAWKELSLILANKAPYDRGGRIQLSDDEPAPQYRTNAEEALDQIARLDLGYKPALKAIGTVEIPAADWNPHGNPFESDGGGPLKEKFIAAIKSDEKSAFRYSVRNQVELLDNVSDIEVQPCDVGTGVSQALPIAVGAFADGCAVMAVEQPELHLHPRLQCDLGDIFIANMHRHPSRIFLIETHSEHLILRLLKRMRETAAGKAPEGKELTPDDVAVLAFEAGESGTEVHEIEISESGELLTPWPNGFFPERMNEILGE